MPFGVGSGLDLAGLLQYLLEAKQRRMEMEMQLQQQQQDSQGGGMSGTMTPGKIMVGRGHSIGVDAYGNKIYADTSATGGQTTPISTQPRTVGFKNPLTSERNKYQKPQLGKIKYGG